LLFLQQNGGFMKNFLPTIKKCPLFTGMEEADIQSILDCLSATERRYEKNSFIFMAGGETMSVGMILSGSAHIVQEDFWGNRTIVAHVSPGELFGEAFSCAELKTLPVSVTAAEKCDVMLIDYRKILTTCPSACGYHSAVIKNMTRILAEKNVMLTQKMEHITRRTTREKLLSYLSAVALGARKNSFRIPFNRGQLAEYLSVDRSAMSAELGRMRDEGILEFHKNNFKLLQGGH